MARFSDYLEQALLNATLRGVVGDLPIGPVFLSLHSADPLDTGGNEITGQPGYARQQIAFDPPVGGQTVNTDLEQFTATGPGWPPIVGFGIWSLVALGNYLYGGTLTTPRTVNDGDTLAFAAGSIMIKLE